MLLAIQVLAVGSGVVDVDPSTSCLPPNTFVGSEGCCIADKLPSQPCNKATTPYGHCARSIEYPKPTPPSYHIADPTCETNDPNAPFYDQRHGVYHLFWQKHCASPVPNEKIKGIVYGHAVSRNLVKWAMMPVAIWNDEDYDRYAIYSGSATVTNDGVPRIIYPGLCLKDEW